MKNVRNQRGFTLMGQIVAIGLAILGMGIVAPMLLSHFADGKTAALGETLKNSSVAFESYFAKNEGILTDSGTAGDYFDDLVADGFMSRVPANDGIAFTIEHDADANNTGAAGEIDEAFYIGGVYQDGDAAVIEKRLTDLDNKIDNATGAGAGVLQWDVTDGTSGKLFYLLHGVGVDLADANWRS